MGWPDLHPLYFSHNEKQPLTIPITLLLDFYKIFWYNKNKKPIIYIIYIIYIVVTSFVERSFWRVPLPINHISGTYEHVSVSVKRERTSGIGADIVRAGAARPFKQSQSLSLWTPMRD